MKNNNAPKILLGVLSIIVIFTLGFYLGSTNLTNNSESNSRFIKDGELVSEQNGVDVSLLWEVWETLEREHIDSDEIDGQKLVYGAAKGIVAGLDDRYTSFLTPEETSDYESSNKREFQGIGTTLAADGEYVIIESPIDGSPAKSSGLKAKDIVLEVDGESMRGKSVLEVATAIRGDAGTKVKISYFRPSENSNDEVEITRQVIDLENMTLEDMGDGIMALKVYQFTEADVATFNREWDKNVAKIVQANPKGLIIDLRNNPGGFVDAVQYAVSDFIPEGKVVFQEENKLGRKTVYEVTRNGKLLEVPIVVLVNEGSASSSEIFAGAIQDHDRGDIVGAKTVGKGVEQKLVDLSDGSMLQVVFQKWLTPSGRNVTTEDPITPDYEILDDDEQLTKAKELLSN